MIVCYAFLAYAAMFERLGRAGEGEPGRRELYDRALAITDSVLYVKQHSVNCIPAALFEMSCLRPEFGREEARAFAESLLVEIEPAADRDAIVSHIVSTYAGLMDERDRGGEDCARILVRFLDRYAAGKK